MIQRLDRKRKCSSQPQ